MVVRPVAAASWRPSPERCGSLALRCGLGQDSSHGRLAALIATGGDDASYLLHVGAALDAGASVDEVTGVLTAIAPNVGVFKMVAAADPLATALRITIAEDDAGDAS